MTPLNSRDLAAAIKVDLQTGIVPNVLGSPGIGKSAMMKGISEELGLAYRPEHLSSKEPTDINGFPDVGGQFATFKSFENFPTEDMEIPKGKNGWLLFLDELNSASMETQAAAYSLVLDRKVGMKNLHEMCFVVAAGNLKTDNAIVNPMSSAMTSRMVNYRMMFDPEVFLEDVVIGMNWEYKTAAYLEWKPEMIHVFDPAKAEDPYACPRTWDMLQQRIAVQGTNYDNKLVHNRAAAEGLVGQAIGREFIAFLNTFGQIPSTADVIRDPIGIAIPASRGLQYATVVQLRRDVDASTLADIYPYIERFDPEFRVTFLRGIVSAKNIPRSHPVIVDAQRNLRRRP